MQGVEQGIAKEPSRALAIRQGAWCPQWLQAEQA